MDLRCGLCMPSRTGVGLFLMAIRYTGSAGVGEGFVNNGGCRRTEASVVAWPFGNDSRCHRTPPTCISPPSSETRPTIEYLYNVSILSRVAHDTYAGLFMPERYGAQSGIPKPESHFVRCIYVSSRISLKNLASCLTSQGSHHNGR